MCDGEQTRQHFVTTFIEHLDGVDFENRKTVRIRNRYDASVPVVTQAVTRPKSVFVEDAKFLRSQTDQPIKWALPNPMTILIRCTTTIIKVAKTCVGVCQNTKPKARSLRLLVLTLSSLMNLRLTYFSMKSMNGVLPH